MAEPLCREPRVPIRDKLPAIGLFSYLAEAQVPVENWRQDDNQHRPHTPLGMMTPGALPHPPQHRRPTPPAVSDRDAGSLGAKPTLLLSLEAPLTGIEGLTG